MNPFPDDGEYNPFDEPAPEAALPPPPDPEQPASNRDYRDPVTGIIVTEKQLEERELALAKREAELSELEQQLADGTYVKPKPEKNFPPLIHLWAWHPDRDLPPDLVTPMKRLLWIFMAAVVVYFVNWIGCLSCLAKGAAERVDSPATKIVVSSIFLFVFCPLAFHLAFFAIYKAMKKRKALKFFCGMIAYAVWFIALVFNVIGIKGGGNVGLITMIDVFSGNAVVGVISLIFTLLGTCELVAMAWSFIWLIKYYKTNGLKGKAIQEGFGIAADNAAQIRTAL